MTASGRPFQTWAAATGKARLPTVDSLMGGMAKRLVLADGRARRPSRSATATRGPRYRGALSCRTLYMYVSTAILYCTRSGTRIASVVSPTHRWCGRAVAGGRWVVPFSGKPATNACNQPPRPTQPPILTGREMSIGLLGQNAVMQCGYRLKESMSLSTCTCPEVAGKTVWSLVNSRYTYYFLFTY